MEKKSLVFNPNCFYQGPLILRNLLDAPNSLNALHTHFFFNFRVELKLLFACYSLMPLFNDKTIDYRHRSFFTHCYSLVLYGSTDLFLRRTECFLVNCSRLIYSISRLKCIYYFLEKREQCKLNNHKRMISSILSAAIGLFPLFV